MVSEPRPIYEIHGLRVASAIRLGVAEVDGTATDLEIGQGPAVAVSAEPPPGRLLREVSFGGGRGVALARDAEGYLLRLYGTCDFRIDGARRTIEARPAPELDPLMLAPLIEGAVLACVLALEGECVLHASAVEMDGGAVALVGRSGQGKSTLATLLCLGGASLVSDDVLRVDLSGEAPRCFPGGRRVRLRPHAGPLLDALPDGAVERTVDDRLGADFAAGRSERPRLAAILIPRPSRSAVAPRLVRLRPAQALVALSRYPRVYGWRDGEPLRRQFEAFSRLARTVTVATAELPWGPPFDSGLCRALLERIEALTARTA